MFKKILGFFSKASNSPIGKVIGTFIPQVGVAGKIIEKINSATGNSFDENTPSEEVKAVMENMTPEQWVELEKSENELEALIQQEITKRIQEETKIEQEETKTLIALNNSETKGSQWRPFIAVGSFIIVAINVLIATIGGATALYSNQPETVNAFLNFGLGMAALIAPLVLWVNRYMGLRTREKEMRYAAAYNQPIRPPQPEGFLGKLNNMLNG